MPDRSSSHRPWYWLDRAEKSRGRPGPFSAYTGRRDPPETMRRVPRPQHARFPDLMQSNRVVPSAPGWPRASTRASSPVGVAAWTGRGQLGNQGAETCVSQALLRQRDGPNIARFDDDAMQSRRLTVPLSSCPVSFRFWERERERRFAGSTLLPAQQIRVFSKRKKCALPVTASGLVGFQIMGVKTWLLYAPLPIGR